VSDARLGANASGVSGWNVRFVPSVSGPYIPPLAPLPAMTPAAMSGVVQSTLMSADSCDEGGSGTAKHDWPLAGSHAVVFEPIWGARRVE
jgi:hypothetical protein